LYSASLLESCVGHGYETMKVEKEESWRGTN